MNFGGKITVIISSDIMAIVQLVSVEMKIFDGEDNIQCTV